MTDIDETLAMVEADERRATYLSRGRYLAAMPESDLKQVWEVSLRQIRTASERYDALDAAAPSIETDAARAAVEEALGRHNDIQAEMELRAVEPPWALVVEDVAWLAACARAAIATEAVEDALAESYAEVLRAQQNAVKH